MYANAVTIFQHTWKPLLVYGGTLAAFEFARLAAAETLENRTTFEQGTVGGVLFLAGTTVAWAALVAVLMSVCFSRIARRIEGAMWRVQDNREALARFFGMWFFLILAGAVITQLGNALLIAADDETAAIPITLLQMFATSLIVPLGTLVIFHGSVGGEEIREGASILEHQFASLMVIILGNMMLMFAGSIAFAALPRWAVPLTAFFSAARVMFVFSCAWAVCVYHRDEYEADNDFDM